MLNPTVGNRSIRFLLLLTTLAIGLHGCGQPAATAEHLTRSPADQQVDSDPSQPSDSSSSSNPSNPSDPIDAAPPVAIEPPADAETDPDVGAATAQAQAVRPAIREGYYSMGGTGQGLEVRGNQYRYYDEDGAYEWRSLRQLTAIGPGHVFDGENYWCHSDDVPGNGGLCTANGWQSYRNVGQISASELGLGGVEAGASEAEVRRQLGQPDQSEQVSPFSSRLIYRGLSVSFYEDAALTIRSVSAAYCTPAGLCPGDAAAVAERLYGAPIVDPRTDADYWQYGNYEAACTMELEVTNETIGAIAIVCQI